MHCRISSPRSRRMAFLLLLLLLMRWLDSDSDSLTLLFGGWLESWNAVLLCLCVRNKVP